MITAEKITILIPSLEPDHQLIPYIIDLQEKGFEDILVVDDGSGEKYQPIFSQIEQMEGCSVLHHEMNKGKGCALKKGYSFLEERGNCKGVVTVDADGQHRVQDVWNIATLIAQEEKGLILGSRDFSMDHVPWKSFYGNRITTGVFWALYGVKLSDTQTGLRGFSAIHLPFMQQVKGERFEYEMNVLIACTREKITMVSVPIETVYEGKNEGSHFRAVRDAIRIYKVLFGNFIYFAGSSIASFLMDYGFFHLFIWLLPKMFILSAEGLMLLGTLLARIISGGFNFIVNKNLVFKEKKGQEGRKMLLRYIALALGIALCSAGGVIALTWLKVPLWLGKIVVDTFLYFLSYRIQRQWVFA